MRLLGRADRICSMSSSESMTRTVSELAAQCWSPSPNGCPRVFHERAQAVPKLRPRGELLGVAPGGGRRPLDFPVIREPVRGIIGKETREVGVGLRLGS